MPQQLLDLAQAQGIQIKYWDFTPPVEALYYSVPGQPPVIGLAKTLPANRAHFRTVLAEELGHHFTTVGEQLPRTLFHYADRLMISKEEYKALKWAAEFLIPMDKLFDVVGDGPTELWEMAERLEVDQSLVEFRLKMVSVTI